MFPGRPEFAREIGLRPPAGFPQPFAGRPERVGDLAAAEPLKRSYSAMFSGGPKPSRGHSHTSGLPERPAAAFAEYWQRRDGCALHLLDQPIRANVQGAELNSS